MPDAGGTGPARSALAAADKHSNAAAAVLGLALPGDTVLYLLLPLHAAVFGVSLGEAGLLLAANRLVRIAGYGWVGRLYHRHGARGAATVACLTAAAATLGYAVLTGVWTLVCARLLWGLSFAALNIATQALATAEPTGAARRNGRSRAIIALGPMLALPIGALVAEHFGPRLVFGLLAGMTLLGLPLALRLPAGEGATIRARPRLSLPSGLDVWSFVQGMMLDGLFVIGLSVLAAAQLPGEAALAAGTALAVRYAAEIALGPSGGILAERWGAERLMVVLSAGSAAGLALIGFGQLWLGVAVVVLLRGLLQPLPAPLAAARYPGGERVGALARLATWRDIGAGLGPLLAGMLLPVVAPSVLYGGAALLLIGAAIGGLPQRGRTH